MGGCGRAIAARAHTAGRRLQASNGDSGDVGCLAMGLFTRSGWYVGVTAIVTALAPGISAAASTPIDAACTAAATTTTTTTAPSTATTTTMVALGLCDLHDQLPPDRVDEEWESVWDGTVIGTIQ